MDPTQTHKLTGMVVSMMVSNTVNRFTDEPKFPGSLATDAELCKHWQEVDAYWGTNVDSPLHHDSRCEIHGWI